jgi:cyclophilin family peptidyl-prolyl cis-trans isomerase
MMKRFFRSALKSSHKSAARHRRPRVRRIEPLERREVLTAPTLPPIDNVTLTAGAALHIPLNGADADGDFVGYQVTSNAGPANDPILKTTVLTGDRSLRMSVDNFGTMEFYLFEDDVPRVTSRIAELANQGFYDGLTFHRIAKDGNNRDFVIQGGDPLGTGTGGSGIDFDDQYHPDLRHTGIGMLSMAKSLEDTNDSQFFITGASTDVLRNLDFNHSVFGVLTSGESVRAAISAVATDANDRPLTPVTIDSVDVITDLTQGVLRLTAPEGASGTVTNVTVTIFDSNGESSQQTFQVTLLPDQRNDTPFLSAIPDLVTNTTTPLTFTLSARDVESSVVRFGFVADPARVNVQLSNTGDVTPDASGLASVTVTLTPVGGFVGNTTITLYAHDPNLTVPASPRTNSTFNAAADLQTTVLTITQGTPVFDTIGLFAPSTDDFSLRNALTPGPPDTTFKYTPSASGSIALTGDWDGDGTDTPGFYNPADGEFALRNANAAGVADLKFPYGPGGPDWVPVVGDWNGDGRDTVGLLYRPFSWFFLRNSNTAGPGEYIFHYGPAGHNWVPLAGDWDGDGVDTVGLYRPVASEFHLRNRDAVGFADIRYVYGSPGQGLVPLVGDWNGDGIDTPGLFSPTPSNFLLRNSNTAGAAEVTVAFGTPGSGLKPLIGDWGGLTGTASTTATASPGPSSLSLEAAADELATATQGDGAGDALSADEVDSLFGSDELLDDLFV